MGYHEYTYGGALHRRNYSSQRFPAILYGDPDSELGQAMSALREKLGPEGYYEWACSLPAHVVMGQRSYIEAIREKSTDIKRINGWRGTQLDFWGMLRCDSQVQDSTIEGGGANGA